MPSISTNARTCSKSSASTSIRMLGRSSEIDGLHMFEIDPSIDAGKISAKIDQGLVTLTLPKAEHVKPRKITVS